MNDYKKDRFIIWLIFLIPSLFTGIAGATAWTTWNIIQFFKEEEEEIDRRTPINQKDEIKNINTKEYIENNLSEDEKNFLENNPDYVFGGRNSNGGAIFYYVKK
jgi:hypothetical protein